MFGYSSAEEQALFQQYFRIHTAHTLFEAINIFTYVSLVNHQA